MEKVDIIKRLIRANNYQHCERVMEQCIELGIHVNRVGLTRFAAKLELIDKAERQRNRRKSAQAKQANIATHNQKKPVLKQPTQRPSQNSSYRTDIPKVDYQAPYEEHFSETFSLDTPPPTNSKVVHLNSRAAVGAAQVLAAPTQTQSVQPSAIPDKLTIEQVQQRKAAITLQLGEMKIREHALLQELNALAEKYNTEK